ncbi:MAG TPA: acetylglutamate kinase [Nitrospirota bacterium]|nr:acetylglutamate kinase [Nitrospirota bacterium]
MKRNIEKAQLLVEALPYIRALSGKTIVIKFGGNAMIDENLKELFAEDVVLTKYFGMSPVVVHGGGPQISEVMDKMGKKPVFIEGIRITDGETMDIVEMVLGGKINKELVNRINQHGGNAVGLTGIDAGLIRARKLRRPRKGAGIDRGLVGEVESISPNIIRSLEQNRFIPVIAPIGVDNKGKTYNINADTAAGAIAATLKAEKLIFLTDVKGILGKDGRLISTLTRKQVHSLIKSGVITSGMLPKVRACLEALDGGVKKTHIIDGRINHSILLEIFTKKGIGTEIVA